MPNSPTKEILLLLREIRDDQIRENKEHRMNNLERTIQVLQGNLEVKEQRLRAIEEYLGVEFSQKSEYIKK